MRLHLLFGGERGKTVIPINYNSSIARYIYQFLKPEQPLEADGKRVEFYTFSNLYIPNVEQIDNELRIRSNRAELTLSIHAPDDAKQEVLQRMKDGAALDIDGSSGQMQLLSIDPLEERLPEGKSVKFRMLSPLLVQREFGKQNEPLVNFNSKEFGERLREVLLLRYEWCMGARPEDTRLDFCLDQKYVNRRKGRISKLVRLDEGTKAERAVRAIIAPFELRGNPELIRFGYVAGFGEKNLLGFGCVEPIISEEK